MSDVSAKAGCEMIHSFFLIDVTSFILDPNSCPILSYTGAVGVPIKLLFEAEGMKITVEVGGFSQPCHFISVTHLSTF